MTLKERREKLAYEQQAPWLEDLLRQEQRAAIEAVLKYANVMREQGYSYFGIEQMIQRLLDD